MHTNIRAYMHAYIHLDPLLYHHVPYCFMAILGGIPIRKTY